MCVRAYVCKYLYIYICTRARVCIRHPFFLKLERILIGCCSAPPLPAPPLMAGPSATHSPVAALYVSIYADVRNSHMLPNASKAHG